MKEWLVPLGLGVLVAAIVLLIPESEPPAQPAVETSCGKEVKWIFEEGPAAFFGQTNTTLLALGSAPNATWCQPPEPGLPNGTVHRINLTSGPIIQVPAQEGRVQCVTAPCPQPVAPWFAVDPTDTRTFTDNTTQVKLELYAFTADGLLLTSTAPSFKLAEYNLYADYFPLNNLWWYLGNQTAPAGSYELPFGTAQAREALLGMPVGGIATVYLEAHPYDWLVGDVWITGRLLDVA